MNKLTMYHMLLKTCMLLCGLSIAPFAMGDKPYNLYWLGTTDIGWASSFGAYSVAPETADTKWLDSVIPSYGYGPIRVSINPNGNYLYVITRDTGVEGVDGYPEGGIIDYYSINSNGTVSWMTRNYEINATANMLFTPDGKFTYLSTNPDGDDYIYLFSTDSSSGALNALNPATLKIKNAIYSMAMNVQGTKFYVGGSGYLYPFNIDITSGALTGFVGSPSVSIQGKARSVIADPAEKFIYVISSDPGYIQTLQLTSFEDETISNILSTSIVNGVSAVISPDGNMLYVTTTEANIISFQIDRATGSLIEVDRDRLDGVAEYDAIAMDVEAGYIFVGISNPDKVMKFAISKSSRKLDLAAYIIDTNGSYNLQTIATPLRPKLLNVQMSIDPDLNSIEVASASPQEVLFTVQSNTGYDLINVEKIFDISSVDIQATITEDTCGSIIGKGGYCTVKAQISNNSDNYVTGVITLHISGNYEYYAQDGVNLLVTTEEYDSPSEPVAINSYNEGTIFVTDLIPKGELYLEADTGNWGVYAADDICNNDTNKPNDGQAYKAMIADNSYRYACYNGLCGEGNNKDWVLKANTTYYNTRGEAIAKTTNDAIFTFPLERAMSPDISDNVWTGLTTAFGADDDCKDWNSDSSDNKGRYGSSSATDSSSISKNEDGCNQGNRLYCVSQH